MHSLALYTLLLAAPSYQDGSLVVLQNSNKPVAAFTGSSVSHVALIGTLAGDPWVYEATPARVRRIALEAYQAELAELNGRRRKPIQMWIMEPKDAYSPLEITKLQRYMMSQLGRRYSVKGYVRGKKGDGVHCAEFSSSALGATGKHRFEREERISPSDLVGHLRPYYQPPIPIKLVQPTSSAGWGDRFWDHMAALRLWCSWACYEMMTFCL